jgi:hypothetical protein
MNIIVFSLLFNLLSFSYGTGLTASTGGEEPSKKEESSNSSFIYDRKLNLLKICFIEELLVKNQPEQAEYLRTHTSYPIEEDFELPRELCKALGSKKALTVKAGTYPVLHANGLYTIVIML